MAGGGGGAVLSWWATRLVRGAAEERSGWRPLWGWGGGRGPGGARRRAPPVGGGSCPVALWWRGGGGGPPHLKVGAKARAPKGGPGCGPTAPGRRPRRAGGGAAYSGWGVAVRGVYVPGGLGVWVGPPGGAAAQRPWSGQAGRMGPAPSLRAAARWKAAQGPGVSRAAGGDRCSGGGAGAGTSRLGDGE